MRFETSIESNILIVELWFMPMFSPVGDDQCCGRFCWISCQ